MARKKSGWSSGITWLVVLTALGGAAYWYFKKDDSGPQFQTATIPRGDITQAVTATGSLTPVVNVQVGSQISGRIKAIYADFNSSVKSNQVIAEIDPSTYEVAVLRAEAQVSNAVANVTLARVQANRASSLFESKLIPNADFDTAIAQLQQAEANLRSSEAALASAVVDLSRCEIRAPVDGVVISRNVDVGQTVAASFNTPTLFIIANDLSKMQIAALVSEADIGGVETGQNATFTVDAYPYRTFRGQVSQVRYGAVTNQNVVNYSAIIEVNNDDLKLLPSMTANVSIILREREGVLKLPNAALRFRPPEGASAATNKTPAMTGAAQPGAQAARPTGDRPRGEGRGGGGLRGNRNREGGPAGEARPMERTVYILEGAGTEEPKLKPVQIRTGISDGASTEILDGLEEGAQVVTGISSSGANPAAQSNPFSGGGRPGGFRRF